MKNDIKLQVQYLNFKKNDKLDVFHIALGTAILDTNNQVQHTREYIRQCIAFVNEHIIIDVDLAIASVTEIIAAIASVGKPIYTEKYPELSALEIIRLPAPMVKIVAITSKNKESIVETYGSLRKCLRSM